MKLLYLFASLLVLPACGQYVEDSVSHESAEGAAGHASAELMSSCHPTDLGSGMGVLVPGSTPFPGQVALNLHGCDPSNPGQVQYLWRAPHTGCYTWSTLGSDPVPAHLALRVSRETCDGALLQCFERNYGASWMERLAEGEGLIFTFSRVEPQDGRTYTLSVNYRPCP